VLRVGLTGGIACGKSRVRRQLAAAGFGTLDLDGVAHELIAPTGAAYADVVNAFPGVLAPDGTVDRKALGARVFADGEARARLNALVHPRVREEEARRAAAYEARGGRVFVTDAALLVEAGMHLRFDRLVVVDCEGGEQLRRLMARDGLDEAAARGRVGAQMPAHEKRRFAHIVVDASGTLEATDILAAGLAASLAALAQDTAPHLPLRGSSVVAALDAGPPAGPRGLDPRKWVADVAAAEGAEMESLKRLLDPPFSGPWYAAAAGSAVASAGAGPEALSPVVGLWSRGRRGLDQEFTAGAMFSIAYLVDRDAVRIAGACLLALAAAHLGSGARLSPEGRADWTAVAERWAQASPGPSAHATLEAALRHPGAAPTAAENARAHGGDPRVAAALAAAAAL
jgi:dephospho-CoA kinase